MKSQPIQLPPAVSAQVQSTATQVVNTVGSGISQIQGEKPWINDAYSDQAISGFSKVL